MRNVVIKIAIMFPHMYPWKCQLHNEKINIEKEELDSILREEKILDADSRRIAAWHIERLMYFKALEVNSVEALSEEVEKEFSNLNLGIKKLPRELIRKVLTRKDLNNNIKLNFYKNFITGKMSKGEYDSNIDWVYIWLTDLLASYFISASGGGNNLKEQICKEIKNLVYQDHYKEEKVFDVIKRGGFTNEGICNLYGSNFKKYLKNYETLLKAVIDIASAQEEEKPLKTFEESNIGAALFGMIEAAEKTNNEVKVKNNSKLKEAAKAQEEKNASKEQEEKNEAVIKMVMANLEKMAEDLDCKILSNSQYNSLINRANAGKHHEEKMNIIEQGMVAQFIKKLVNPSEGAVLSQLYNLYLKIDEVEGSNIKSALKDFFNTLMILGLEADEDGGRVGDKVEVQNQDLLKKYLLTRPMEGDGRIRGVIKFSGWRYENKTLIPPVVQQIK